MTRTEALERLFQASVEYRVASDDVNFNFSGHKITQKNCSCSAWDVLQRLENRRQEWIDALVKVHGTTDSEGESK